MGETAGRAGAGMQSAWDCLECRGVRRGGRESMVTAAGKAGIRAWFTIRSCKECVEQLGHTECGGVRCDHGG